MREEKDLREELLSQNGMASGWMSPEEKEKLRRLLKRDRARVTRMKWAAIIAWLLILLVPLVGAAISHIPVRLPFLQRVMDLGIVGGMAMIYIAIFFTINYFFRSRSLGMRQIQASLRDIQDQLDRMAAERQRPSDRE